MSESVLDSFDTAIDLVVKRLGYDRVKDLQRKIIYDKKLQLTYKEVMLLV